MSDDSQPVVQALQKLLRRLNENRSLAQLCNVRQQPIRQDLVGFFFRARAIQKLERLAGFVEGNVPAGKPFLLSVPGH